MQRLGKNVGRYLGDTIDIQQVLRDVGIAAQKHGWNSELFYETSDLKLACLTRPAKSPSKDQPRRIYISAGIHGDEPAGPLAALKLIQENQWPENLDLWFCPCLNPLGFALNTRENSKGFDLNREYLKPVAEEITAHITSGWKSSPQFRPLPPAARRLGNPTWQLLLIRTEPDAHPSLAEPMIEAVSKVCPVDPSDIIEDRPAKNGIIRPNIDIRTRPLWAEAFFLIAYKTRMSYTLEAPSDYPLSTRIDGLVAAVRAGVGESHNG